jgi:hypothetical protein
MLAFLLLGSSSVFAASPENPQASGSEGSAAAAADAPVATVQPPRVAIESGVVRSAGLVTVVVTAVGRETLTLDGCVPMELERWEGNAWVRAVLRGCGGGVAGLPVAPRLALTLPAPSPGRWRAVVGWGARCQPALPLAFASCTDSGTTYSEPFDVRPD